MSRGDLHHPISLASKIYEKLETLEIKSSLLQIIAQDSLYPRSLRCPCKTKKRWCAYQLSLLSLSGQKTGTIHRKDIKALKNR